jgi:L-aminopeptidase/D-esterase-like protein
MICHDFKGGIGTASRSVAIPGRSEGFTVGILLQANHGRRADLRIAGRRIGLEITDLMPELVSGPRPSEAGSVIVVVATDAPLLPHQLERLARRVPLGLSRTGCFGANGSGDLFLAFSTANPGAGDRSRPAPLGMLPNDLLDPLFEATVQGVEEAVVNALVAARTMTGIAGNVVHALPHARLREVFGRPDRI